MRARAHRAVCLRPRILFQVHSWQNSCPCSCRTHGRLLCQGQLENIFLIRKVPDPLICAFKSLRLARPRYSPILLIQLIWDISYLCKPPLSFLSNVTGSYEWPPSCSQVLPTFKGKEYTDVYNRGQNYRGATLEFSLSHAPKLHSKFPARGNLFGL